MKKPQLLYHGSIKKIVGNKLIPKKPMDLEEKPENLHTAVYATNIKDIAIAMAIISCKGVIEASLNFRKKPHGLIYEGWPKQKYVYLYTLLSTNFKKTDKSKKQWISKRLVKPLKIEKISVLDYINLVRKATKKEIKIWFKKYRDNRK